jgi:ketosteroid isomerase-like protein
MSERENRETIDSWMKALNERDLELFNEVFQEDSVVEYPQSGERIVGGENRRAVYGAFPGLPRVDPRRILVSGDLGVVEARLDYGDGADWQAVIVLEFRDGKIANETAWWSQPFEAAEWRSGWVERIDVG